MTATPIINTRLTLLLLTLGSTIFHVQGFAPQVSTTRLRKCFKSISMSPTDDLDIHVMVNGMPGPMATAAAEACLRKGLKLTPVAMTGPDVEPMTIMVYDPVSEKSSEVKLIPSTQRDDVAASIQGLKEACGEKNVLAIDYTHPSAVNSNADFYVEQKLPFVMGTTGGDREKLVDGVNAAKHFAVIAPNMAKQIVAMQAALEDLAKKYPGAFSSYTMACKESHQKTKADTSGTAKAVIDSLKELSDDDFTYDDIQMIRDDQEALDFGVPEDALKGHAFHRYTLTSADGSTQFALEHNVAGRTIYAEGTADAVKFLAERLQEGGEGKVYTMINVLESGALE
ncbi:dihydrodipicolinate reductase [Nitzschia inconspicua]|uniref:4-hydroxy-tetrahydrodipicolinate reductase n=1 Tax=Nitzschia inconspicua TaxID=303405 RepID=A0A9K3KG71_9STRA|nr:dihydrodipicolinate reductase [Nitzschia inconspicua]